MKFYTKCDKPTKHFHNLYGTGKSPENRPNRINNGKEMSQQFFTKYK